MLNVTGGGKVTSGDAFVGTESGELGIVALVEAGSSWAITGVLEVGADLASAPGSTGIIAMEDARLSATGDICVEKTGTIDGTGTVSTGGRFVVYGTLGARIVQTRGTAPKRPEAARAKAAQTTGGTLTVEGDLVLQPTGIVVAEAAGPQAGRVVVTGDATLGGTLVLQFRNGFAPRAGDPFEVLQANGTVTGEFTAVEVRGLAPGAQFDVAKSGTSWVATAAADTVALPSVGIKGSPRKLLEKKPKKKGALTFRRTGDPSAPLTVAYLVRGTAENGGDCVQLPGSVTFPAKKRTVKVAVEVAPDAFRENAETLEVTLVPGADYTTSVASTATFVLVDSPPR
jgi:hypothetical protein